MNYHTFKLTFSAFSILLLVNIAAGLNCGGTIALDSTNSRESLVIDGTCSTCSTTVTSPTGTVLNATFIELRVPSDNTMKFVESGLTIASISNIIGPFDPIYSHLSTVSVQFDSCGSSSPNTLVEVEFSYLDNFGNGNIVSSGGQFRLNASKPSLTLQSSALSIPSDASLTLEWYISANPSSTDTWLKVDILTMMPRNNELCIYDSFSAYGDWTCMKNNISSITWYSYGNQLRIGYYANLANDPGDTMIVRISFADTSSWGIQPLTLRSCNANVQLEDASYITFVSPFYSTGHSADARYDCKMKFRSSDVSGKARLDFQHYDHLGNMKASTVLNGNTQVIADLSRVGSIDGITQASPAVCISPNNQLFLDVSRGYSDDDNGIMFQGRVEGGVLSEQGPIETLGISTELNDTSTSVSFTTPGYPLLPDGKVHTYWFIDNAATGDTAFELSFVDFDIGRATLFVHVAETSTPLLQRSGSSLPNVMYADTATLTILLRSDNPGTGRGLNFTTSLIPLINECAETPPPCINGGTCRDDWISFNCDCPQLFTGETCQEAIPTQAFVTEPEDTEATTEESVILYCVVEYKEGTAEWGKDGVVISSDSSITNASLTRYSIAGNASYGEFNLRIDTVSMEDAGTYGCRVTAVGLSGEIVSRDAMLRVYNASQRIVTPPSDVTVTVGMTATMASQRIVTPPSDVTVTVGMTATMVCNVTALSGDVEWLKNGVKISTNRQMINGDISSRVSITGSDATGEYDLSFAEVQFEDDALYFCTLSPGANGDPAVTSLHAKLTVVDITTTSKPTTLTSIPSTTTASTTVTTVGLPDQGATSPPSVGNTVIITLCICLTVAFVLITGLVYMLIKRGKLGKTSVDSQAVYYASSAPAPPPRDIHIPPDLAGNPSAYATSTDGQINHAYLSVCEFPDPGDKPPEYETIPAFPNVRQGSNTYMALQSPTDDDGYLALRSSVASKTSEKQPDGKVGLPPTEASPPNPARQMHRFHNISRVSPQTDLSNDYSSTEPYVEMRQSTPPPAYYETTIPRKE